MQGFLVLADAHAGGELGVGGLLGCRSAITRSLAVALFAFFLNPRRTYTLRWSRLV
jgi:hypothetical protein